MESLYFIVVVKTGKLMLLARSHAFYNLPLPPVPPSLTFRLISGPRKAKLWAAKLDIRKCSRKLFALTEHRTKASVFFGKKLTDACAFELPLFCYLRKTIDPRQSPKLSQLYCTCLHAGSPRERLGYSEDGCLPSARCMCLWFVVSVTANLTKTIPQVSVTAQEMLSPPTRRRERVSAAASTH